MTQAGGATASLEAVSSSDGISDDQEDDCEDQEDSSDSELDMILVEGQNNLKRSRSSEFNQQVS